MLIEVAGVEGIPSVQLGDDGQVAEPVVLEGLVEIARGAGRDMAADLGDLQQPGAALGARLAAGPFPGQGGVAFREEDEGVARDVKRPERLAFLVGLRVVEEIEPRNRCGYLFLEVEHPLGIDLVVQHGVARGALLHELGEDPGVVGLLPFRRELGEHPVAHRAAAPIRDDLLFVELEALAPTRYQVLGRESRMRRSSRLWQVSSGNVGTAFGRGPRSPTMSSSSPEVEGFVLAEVWKARARSTGTE